MIFFILEYCTVLWTNEENNCTYLLVFNMFMAMVSAAKGNSLFAEVEDKRQEMAKNLIQMKQTNSRVSKLQWLHYIFSLYVFH